MVTSLVAATHESIRVALAHSHSGWRKRNENESCHSIKICDLLNFSYELSPIHRGAAASECGSGQWVLYACRHAQCSRSVRIDLFSCSYCPRSVVNQLVLFHFPRFASRTDDGRLQKCKWNNFICISTASFVRLALIKGILHKYAHIFRAGDVRILWNN